MDRYKAAVARAHDLRESGKLPKNFDWSRLEDTEDEEIDELVSDILDGTRHKQVDEAWLLQILFDGSAKRYYSLHKCNFSTGHKLSELPTKKVRESMHLHKYQPNLTHR